MPGDAPNQRLTHLDERGNARMVDVSAKQATTRRAVAEGVVRMEAATLALLASGRIRKGDAIAVARIAGIQGAKRASDLVPLCHPVRLDKVSVDLEPEGDEHGGVPAIRITVEAIAFDRTGVEMEALCGVSAAALALYDMIKGVDRSASIEGVRLLAKEGGRSGTWARQAPAGGDGA